MPLKFVIRTSNTSYPLVIGRRRLKQKEIHHDTIIPPLLRHKRYFPVQVCSTDSSYSIHNTIQVSPFCGCCNQENESRMILLREKNFVSYCPLWDLYVVLNDQYQQQNSTTSIKAVPYELLSMALVPRSYQVEQQECRQWPWWSFVGTCYASTIRLDMEAALSIYLHKNNLYRHSTNSNQYHYHHPYVPEPITSSSYHWHVDVYMDQIIDESYLCISQSTCPISISYQSILNGPIIINNRYIENKNSYGNYENGVIATLTEMDDTSTCINDIQELVTNPTNNKIIDNTYIENKNSHGIDEYDSLTIPTVKDDTNSTCTNDIQELVTSPTTTTSSNNNILSTSDIRRLKKIRRKKRQEYAYSLQNMNLDVDDEKENMLPYCNKP